MQDLTETPINAEPGGQDQKEKWRATRINAFHIFHEKYPMPYGPYYPNYLTGSKKDYQRLRFIYCYLVIFYELVRYLIHRSFSIYFTTTYNEDLTTIFKAL
jgi:hypothetical protein